MADKIEAPIPRKWHDTPAEMRRDWHYEVAESRRHRRRIFALLAAMTALVGLIAGLLTWIHAVPSPYFVPLFITEYQARAIPVNKQADPDREALRNGNYFERVDLNAFASQERALLEQDLASLIYRSPRESLVVYFCALAMTAEDGDIAVLAADSQLREPRTRVPLRQLLRYIKNAPCKNKLLLLDIMKPIADPRIGVLVNDVPQYVAGIVEEVNNEEPRERQVGFVLCACSAGQESLVSESMNRSVFGYYVEEGLRGWADLLSKNSDGRVSVLDLASYVTYRVDRWAIQNRQTRQSPVLLGSGKDFQLVALERGRPSPKVTMSAPETYPAWLTAGWKLRDQWFSDGSYRFVPRYFSRLQSAVKRADEQWRGGVDPTRVQSDLADSMERIQSLMKQARRQIPNPMPRSLALAIRQGQVPDRAMADELRDLVTKYFELAKTQKPEELKAAQDKLLADFMTKYKTKTLFDFSWAGYRVLLADQNPTIDKIRLVDRILNGISPKPVYVETLFVYRLRLLTDQFTPTTWPTATIRTALLVVNQGEEVAAQVEQFPWVRGLIDEAALYRYQAEYLLWSRGYAPLSLVDQYLKRASDLYGTLWDHQETIQRAQEARDLAYYYLPTFTPYLVQAPLLEKAWTHCIQDCIQLEQALQVPAPGQRLDQSQLRQKCDSLRQATSLVRARLKELNWPFEADRLNNMLIQTQQSDANVANAQTMRFVLSMPYLRADDRAVLWEAAMQLLHRLEDSTFELDELENQRRTLTVGLSDYAFEKEHFEKEQQEQAATRARLCIQVLELGGGPAEQIDRMKAELEKALAAPPKGRWAEMTRTLRTTWLSLLPKMIQSTDDLQHQDRLSRIFPGLNISTLLDEPQTNPTLRIHVDRWREALGWQADFARYLSHDDGFAQAFYSELSNDYEPQESVRDESVIHFSGFSEIPPLTFANPAVSGKLEIKAALASGRGNTFSFRIITADDDWLTVKPDLYEFDLMSKDTETRLYRNCSVPLQIALKPGAEFTTTPRPLGFLVEVTLNGRRFHYPVSVPALPLPASERVDLIFGPSPMPSNTSVNDLRLRPLNIRQPFYLFVRNSTAKPRNVVVQLKDGDQLIGGADVKVAVGPNEFKPIVFTPPAVPAAGKTTPGAPPAPAAPEPSAAKELPPLRGPLTMLLLDADDKMAVIDQKTVRVSIASPRDYMEVTGIQFIPPSLQNGFKNRLVVKVRATAPISGPPCQVQLVLPPDRIPGFIAAKDGLFSGVLPTNGDELVLYANNIQLENGADPDGYAYLNVDGQERAFVFRTTFARGGDPTTPREDNQPSLRVRAPRFAPSAPNYKVVLEVDHPPANASLDVTLGQVSEALDTDFAEKFPFAKKRFLGFSPFSPSGAVLFQAAISDVSATIDASGIRGTRMIRASLLDGGGKVALEAQQLVTFDDSPPENVQFIDLPAQVRNDQPFAVRATGLDNESGISKVQFFVGKPADGGIPKTAVVVDGTATDATKAYWGGVLTFVPTQKGPTDITVVFTNGVGMTTTATASIDLVTGEVPKGPGIIKGTVLEGSRPQPGLEVVLTDPTAKDKTKQVIGKTKTKPDGTFEFENVAPGAYTVSSAKEETDRVGSAAAVVEPLKTVTVTLNLYLK